MIVGEVKEGKARLNAAMRDLAVLKAALPQAVPVVGPQFDVLHRRVVGSSPTGGATDTL